MNIVDCLLEFDKEQKKDMLVKNDDCDIIDIRVIVSELLSWMKLQYKRVLWIESGRKISLKPLSLNMSYPWCQTLCKYIETQDLFKEVFIVYDGKLNFRTDLSEEYIMYAFKTAYEKYNPQMIVG